MQALKQRRELDLFVEKSVGVQPRRIEDRRGDADDVSAGFLRAAA